MSATNAPVQPVAHPPFTFERVAELALARNDGPRPSASAIASMIWVVDRLEANGIAAAEMRALPSYLRLVIWAGSADRFVIETHDSGHIFMIGRDLKDVRYTPSARLVLEEIARWRAIQRRDAAAGVDR